MWMEQIIDLEDDKHMDRVWMFCPLTSILAVRYGSGPAVRGNDDEE
jgi:hypothetical protein